MLLNGTIVGWICERRAPESHYSFRITAPCDHLHALALVIFLAARRRLGRGVTIGG
jgi:hypothetical protein